MSQKLIIFYTSNQFWYAFQHDYQHSLPEEEIILIGWFSFDLKMQN
jgi:hypothetical protein